MANSSCTRITSPVVGFKIQLNQRVFYRPLYLRNIFEQVIRYNLDWGSFRKLFQTREYKYNLFTYSSFCVLYSSSAHPVICEGGLVFYSHAIYTDIANHSTKREAWTHKTSLTLPLLIEMTVPIQGNDRSCIYV